MNVKKVEILKHTYLGLVALVLYEIKLGEIQRDSNKENTNGFVKGKPNLFCYPIGPGPLNVLNIFWIGSFPQIEMIINLSRDLKKNRSSSLHIISLTWLDISRALQVIAREKNDRIHRPESEGE